MNLHELYARECLESARLSNLATKTLKENVLLKGSNRDLLEENAELRSSVEELEAKLRAAGLGREWE